MDLVDIIVSRIDGDSELKKPIHALVSFTDTDIGKRLGIVAAHFTVSRLEKSSITFLQIQSSDSNISLEMIDSDVYQNKTFTELIEKSEKNKITIRTFIKRSHDYVSDILTTSKEQGCSLVLFGVDAHRFSPKLWQKYYRLKSNPTHSDSYVLSQFQPDEARILNNITTLINSNPIPTGLFMDQGLKEASKIFVPILSPADVQMLPYVHFRFAQKDDMELMIWDAIGAIESDPRIHKLYMMIAKKTDGKVMLWDNDKKIERDFIEQQDLVIMGIDGWEKLIITTLSWTDSLPSILIIKDNIL